MNVMIKRTWRTHSAPLPCFGHIFSCAVRKVCWPEMKVEVDHEEQPVGVDSAVSESQRGPEGLG